MNRVRTSAYGFSVAVVLLLFEACSPAPAAMPFGFKGPEPYVDCSNIPDVPSEPTVLEARASRGIAFDDEGYLLGVSRGDLFRSPYAGPPELFVPGLGGMNQIARLADGDFVAADAGSERLLRISANGGVVVLATDIRAYGVLVAPDGSIFTAHHADIYRVDPESGAKTVWLAPTDFQPRVLEFNRDFSRLFIGALGKIMTVELDDALNPIGAATLWRGDIGYWYEGIGIDACGQVYLADCDTKAVYRISADAETVTPLTPTNGFMLAHGLVWGSGVGGWRSDALYFPHARDGDAVSELVLGLPSRTFEGVVIGR